MLPNQMIQKVLQDIQQIAGAIRNMRSLVTDSSEQEKLEDA